MTSLTLTNTGRVTQNAGYKIFTGYPRDGPLSSAKVYVPGGLAIDTQADLERAITLFDRNRVLSHIPKVRLVRGDAQTTIPAYIQANPHLVVSLLWLDFDIYAPTATALRHFLPRMPKGAIIAFDELNHEVWPGETVAVLEEVGLNRLRLQRFAFGSTLSYARLD